MYVVLTQDVPQLGSKNALVKVAEGYFMNYLMPRGLAQQATPDLIEAVQSAQASQAESKAADLKAASEVAKKLEGATLVIKAKTSDKGTLFKALSEEDMVAALTDQHGVTVSASDIEMDHFKKIGDHQMTLHLADQDVAVAVTIEEEA